VSAHTPGPWRVEGAGVIWSPAAKATIAAASELRAERYVAFTMPRFSSPDLAEIHANARLIAAAPELLAALHKILPHAEAQDCGGPDIGADLSLARAAIAKATQP
jgi:hypothetical protein